ncbi:hypothetical protein B0H10DRAFT_1993911 [Mycena sp. CBHHK59/15]|nr:hypothetical protein B0H10DRAFT_1993911 [Mycena sp. CBHHK59/15]
MQLPAKLRPRRRARPGVAGGGKYSVDDRFDLPICTFCTFPPTGSAHPRCRTTVRSNARGWRSASRWRSRRVRSTRTRRRRGPPWLRRRHRHRGVGRNGAGISRCCEGLGAPTPLIWKPSDSPPPPAAGRRISLRARQRRRRTSLRTGRGGVDSHGGDVDMGLSRGPRWEWRKTALARARWSRRMRVGDVRNAKNRDGTHRKCKPPSACAARGLGVDTWRAQGWAGRRTARRVPVLADVSHPLAAFDITCRSPNAQNDAVRTRAAPSPRPIARATADRSVRVSARLRRSSRGAAALAQTDSERARRHRPEPQVIGRRFSRAREEGERKSAALVREGESAAIP